MLSIGRQGQLYVVKEVTQGTTPALAASHAMRHKNVTLPFDNKNRRTVIEKKQSPGTITAARTDQRKTGSYSLDAILRPSGTLNTVPECDVVLEAGFGVKTNVTLSTTVSATPAPTETTATVASAGTLAVGDAILITCPDGKKRGRFLTVVAGAALTWAPALPTGQAPATGAAVKGGITYKLSSLLVFSFSLAHYLKKSDGTAGLKRVASLCGAESLSLLFDANDEPMIKVGGTAKQIDEAPAQPGAFTMVGGQPPSGISGELLIGDTAMKFLKASFDIKNALWWRNEDYGDSAATEMFRKDRREVSVSVDTRAETEATLYDLAEAGTNVGIFTQTGFTESKIIAVRAPQVEFKVPDTDDPDDLVNWPFKGVALESADDKNDELYCALL